MERSQLGEAEGHRLGNTSGSITKYQVEILENKQGKQVIVPFPEGVLQGAQYGDGVKAHAVYMSVYQQ
jgi:hypothetical protein